MFFENPDFEEGAGEDPPKKQKAASDSAPPLKIYTPQAQIQYGSNAPGANMPSKDKGMKLLDANRAWLSDIEGRMTKNDIEYATSLFSTLNSLPLIDNKPVQLSDLSTVMSDPKKRKMVMDQAAKLEENPELDIDTKWNIIENHYKNLMLSGLLLEGNKRIDEDVRKAANILNQKQIHTGKDGKNAKGTPDFDYTSLFKGDKFISESEWELNQVNKMIEDQNNRILSARMQTAKPSSLMQSFYRQQHQDKYGWADNSQSGAITPINLPGSKINYNKLKEQQLQQAITAMTADGPILQPVTAKNYKSSSFYNQVKGRYNIYKDKVYEQYNANYDPTTMGPNSPRKLSADIEGKFSNNKGGEIHSPIITMNFDFNKPFIKSDMVNVDDETGQVTIGKDVDVMDEGVKDVVGLFKIALNKPKEVIIGLGGIKDKVPSESWNRGEEAIKAVITQTSNYKLGNKKIPNGTLTFQGIVGGEQKYHAYNVKLNPMFFGSSPFQGKGKIGKLDNSDEPNKDLIDNGFTIYLPVELSGTKVGLGVKNSDGSYADNVTLSTPKLYKKASTITPVEGLFNWKNEIPIDIPEGGKIHLIKDGKTGEITMKSYLVSLNTETQAMDTTPVNIAYNKFGADAATDLDAIVNDNLKVIKRNWYINQKKKELLSTPGKVGNE